MLRVEDCVKDRLASFYFWNDKESLNQAIDVCKEQKIDFKEIAEWSQQEGYENKFQEFLEQLHKSNE